MKIITVDREFGSGGRELGKRLSDALGIPCYDEQIIEMLSKEHGLSKEYISHISEKCFGPIYPLTIGRHLSTPNGLMKQPLKVAVSQTKLIEELASQGDCIIIGRCADAILKGHRLLNLFVYAEHQAKLNRCVNRAPEGERLSPSEIERKMKQIDRDRACLRQVITGEKWGQKENYHLCINTTDIEIRALIPALVEYVQKWFEYHK